jgi:hypothetical protein
MSTITFRRRVTALRAFRALAGLTFIISITLAGVCAVMLVVSAWGQLS